MTASVPKKPTVLVVEDEEDVLALIRYNLHKAGFRMLTAGDGLSALRMARREMPDAVVLDLMLPEMSGEEVCRRLKAEVATAAIPVIMLTAKARPEDRIAGLELGADDYLPKPFSPRELILRVQATLRRVQSGARPEVLRGGPFEMNHRAFTARMDGEKLDLTLLEFKLLAMLVERRGRPLSRETLLRQVWSYRHGADTRTVDTHMRRLRAKLGVHADLLETVRGEGYRFRGLED